MKKAKLRKLIKKIILQQQQQQNISANDKYIKYIIGTEVETTPVEIKNMIVKQVEKQMLRSKLRYISNRLRNRY